MTNNGSVKEEPQIGLEDEMLDQPEVLKLLEVRKKAAAARNLDAIKALEIGGDVRIGPFKIKVTKIEPQDIEFTTEGGARVSIKEVEPAE